MIKLFKFFLMLLIFASIFKIFDPATRHKHKPVEVASAHPASFYDFDTVYRGK